MYDLVASEVGVVYQELLPALLVEGAEEGPAEVGDRGPAPLAW